MMPALLPVYERADIEFTHAMGVYIFDKSGRKYLDFAAGYAAMALGHCHPKLVDALCNQAHKLWHLSNKYKIPGLVEYCQRLLDLSFADTVYIANTGAEAVETMIKMARRYFNEKGQKKYRFITFDGAFHGRTMACISAGSAEKIVGFEPAMDGFDRVAWNDIEAVKSAITEETAGILIEPIQGEGGMRANSEEFMKQLREICDKHALLLMLDEVQCGMGRTGFMFAHEMYGVKPDLVALGKGLGAGFPISACLATEAVGRAMKVGSHGSTFGGNPLAVAVGNAVLDIMTEKQFLDNVKRMSSYLKSRLEELQSKHKEVIECVTGRGLMLGIQLKEGRDVELANKYCYDEFILATPASNNVLRITPPLVITEAHCDEAFEKLDKVFTRMEKPASVAVGKLKKAWNSVKRKLGFSD